MTETLYGAWSLQVTKKDPARNFEFHQRFEIIGSDASDGLYNGTPGFAIEGVSGPEWHLGMWWIDSSGVGWEPCGTEREATYTPEEGLVFRVVALDPVSPSNRHPWYDDMVVVCKSLDPTVTPLGTSRNPFDFTISEHE